MAWLRRAALLLVVLAVVAGALFHRLAHRALPRLAGNVAGTGTLARADIVRDRWGVPHIFAENDADAAFALGYVHAQDRLFQMDVTRHVGQGRLSELFGDGMLKADRLFRTMGFHAVGARMLARARPEARRDAEAYARGVNAAVHALDGRLPIEYAILGAGFEPAKPDDFVGVLGYMAWGLNMSWHFDPLFDKLVRKLGPERAAELFPYNFGGLPSVHPDPTTRLALFDLGPEAEAALALAPSLRASNNWVLGPRKTTTGGAILANDPHLGHGAPGIWYQAHLRTPTLDVIGVTLPGFPLVTIGHNRDIAWGMTNVMLDAADFFVEDLDADRVRSGSEWIPLQKRSEEIKIRRKPSLTFEVRTTPRGPLVSELIPGTRRALSYKWNFLADAEANEVDGFYALNRARNWEEFRAALRSFGAISQNVAYADRAGHIGLQTCGRIPRYRAPKLDGSGFRDGSDPNDEWDGYVPFEELPSSFDPPEGWLASANNPTVAKSPYYISSQWEPVDRILRIRELIRAKDKLSLQDVERMHMDTLFVTAREWTPLLLAAFAKQPSNEPTEAAALVLFHGWNGEMAQDAPQPALFAVFYRWLFYAIFEDDLGIPLARGYRGKANVSAIMMRAAIEGHDERWFDRAETPETESREDILRAAFGAAVRDLRKSQGDDPRSWRWGRLHTLTFQHPLGKASRLLGLYFDRGPYVVAGHTSTINKMEFGEDSFAVLHGPSMRQITDLADLERSLAVLPLGQSGIPASGHYDDMLPLWKQGGYHPFLMDRQSIEAVALGTLTLLP